MESTDRSTEALDQQKVNRWVFLQDFFVRLLGSHKARLDNPTEYVWKHILP